MEIEENNNTNTIATVNTIRATTEHIEDDLPSDSTTNLTADKLLYLSSTHKLSIMREVFILVTFCYILDVPLMLKDYGLCDAVGYLLNFNRFFVLINTARYIVFQLANHSVFGKGDR